MSSALEIQLLGLLEATKNKQHYKIIKGYGDNNSVVSKLMNYLKGPSFKGYLNLDTFKDILYTVSGGRVLDDKGKLLTDDFHFLIDHLLKNFYEKEGQEGPYYPIPGIDEDISSWDTTGQAREILGKKNIQMLKFEITNELQNLKYDINSTQFPTTDPNREHYEKIIQQNLLNPNSATTAPPDGVEFTPGPLYDTTSQSYKVQDASDDNEQLLSISNFEKSDYWSKTTPLHKADINIIQKRINWCHELEIYYIVKHYELRYIFKEITEVIGNLYLVWHVLLVLINLQESPDNFDFDINLPPTFKSTINALSTNQNDSLNLLNENAKKYKKIFTELRNTVGAAQPPTAPIPFSSSVGLPGKTVLTNDSYPGKGTAASATGNTGKGIFKQIGGNIIQKGGGMVERLQAHVEHLLKEQIMKNNYTPKQIQLINHVKNYINMLQNPNYVLEDQSTPLSGDFVQGTVDLEDAIKFEDDTQLFNITDTDYIATQLKETEKQKIESERELHGIEMLFKNYEDGKSINLDNLPDSIKGKIKGELNDLLPLFEKDGNGVHEWKKNSNNYKVDANGNLIFDFYKDDGIDSGGNVTSTPYNKRDSTTSVADGRIFTEYDLASDDNVIQIQKYLNNCHILELLYLRKHTEFKILFNFYKSIFTDFVYYFVLLIKYISIIGTRAVDKKTVVYLPAPIITKLSELIKDQDHIMNSINNLRIYSDPSSGSAPKDNGAAAAAAIPPTAAAVAAPGKPVKPSVYTPPAYNMQPVLVDYVGTAPPNLGLGSSLSPPHGTGEVSNYPYIGKGGSRYNYIGAGGEPTPIDERRWKSMMNGTSATLTGMPPSLQAVEAKRQNKQVIDGMRWEPATSQLVPNYINPFATDSASQAQFEELLGNSLKYGSTTTSNKPPLDPATGNPLPGAPSLEKENETQDKGRAAKEGRYQTKKDDYNTKHADILSKISAAITKWDGDGKVGTPPHNPTELKDFINNTCHYGHSAVRVADEVDTPYSALRVKIGDLGTAQASLGTDKTSFDNDIKDAVYTESLDTLLDGMHSNITTFMSTVTSFEVDYEAYKNKMDEIKTEAMNNKQLTDEEAETMKDNYITKISEQLVVDFIKNGLMSLTDTATDNAEIIAYYKIINNTDINDKEIATSGGTLKDKIAADNKYALLVNFNTKIFTYLKGHQTTHSPQALYENLDEYPAAIGKLTAQDGNFDNINPKPILIATLADGGDPNVKIDEHWGNEAKQTNFINDILGKIKDPMESKAGTFNTFVYSLFKGLPASSTDENKISYDCEQGFKKLLSLLAININGGETAISKNSMATTSSGTIIKSNIFWDGPKEEDGMILPADISTYTNGEVSKSATAKEIATVNILYDICYKWKNDTTTEAEDARNKSNCFTYYLEKYVLNNTHAGKDVFTDGEIFKELITKMDFNEQSYFQPERADFIDIKIGSARVVIVVNSRFSNVPDNKADIRTINADGESKAKKHSEKDTDGKRINNTEELFLVTGKTPKSKENFHNYCYIPTSAMCNGEIEGVLNKDVGKIEATGLIPFNKEKPEEKFDNTKSDKKIVIWSGPYNQVYSDETKFTGEKTKNLQQDRPVSNSTDEGMYIADVVENSFSDAIDKLKMRKSVITFGFGFSGSGKTYQLVTGGDIGPKKDKSILFRVVDEINKNFASEINKITFSMCELYAYEEVEFSDKFSNAAAKTAGANGKLYFKDDLPVLPNGAGQYTNQITVGTNKDIELDDFFASGDAENALSDDLKKITFNTIDERVKLYRYNTMRIAPTPNNSESSRSHLFYEFEFDWKTIPATLYAEGDPEVDSGDKNIGDIKTGEIPATTCKFCVVDMAGTENTIEIKKQFFNIEPTKDKFHNAQQLYNISKIDKSQPEWASGPITITDFGEEGKINSRFLANTTADLPSSKFIFGKEDKLTFLFNSSKANNNKLGSPKSTDMYGAGSAMGMKLNLQIKTDNLIWRLTHASTEYKENLLTKDVVEETLQEIFLEFNIILNGVETKDQLDIYHLFLHFGDMEPPQREKGGYINVGNPVKPNEGESDDAYKTRRLTGPSNAQATEIKGTSILSDKLNDKIKNFLENLISSHTDTPESKKYYPGKLLESDVLEEKETKSNVGRNGSGYWQTLVSEYAIPNSKFIDMLYYTYREFILEDLPFEDSTIFSFLKAFVSESNKIKDNAHDGGSGPTSVGGVKFSHNGTKKPVNFKDFITACIKFVEDPATKTNNDAKKLSLRIKSSKSCVHLFYLFLIDPIIKTEAIAHTNFFPTLQLAFMNRYTQMIVNQGRGVVTSLEHIKYYFLYKSPNQARLHAYNKTGNDPSRSLEKRYGYNVIDTSATPAEKAHLSWTNLRDGKMSTLIDNSVKYKIESSGMIETREMGFMQYIGLIQKMNEIVGATKDEKLTATHGQDHLIRRPMKNADGTDGGDIVDIGKTTDCLFIMLACILRYEGRMCEQSNKYCNATFNTLKLCEALSSTERTPPKADTVWEDVKNKLMKINVAKDAKGKKKCGPDGVPLGPTYMGGGYRFIKSKKVKKGLSKVRKYNNRSKRANKKKSKLLRL